MAPCTRVDGEAAQIRQGHVHVPLGDVEGVVQFDSPGGNSMTSILLTPEAITQDNLQTVVDAGWISTDELCVGVEAGAVAACG